MTNSNLRRVVQEASAVVFAVVLLAAFSVPLDAAERTATSSRSGSVSRSDISTKTSSASSSTRSSSGASVTRSSGRSGGGTAHRGSSSRPPRRHHYSSYYGYNHRNYWGAYFGFYPWGYYSYYGYPYYPILPTLYYGPHPSDYRDHRLGALDLNVKPKKAEVWVDGQLIGASGKFDGFPGYLWLDRGRHQLIFHRPGFATEVREVRVLQGTVVKVNLRLEEGESVAPEKLATNEFGRRQRPVHRAEAPIAEKAPLEIERRARVEPGRLLLSIEPGDASVYLDSRFLGTADELSKLHAGLLVNAGQHTLEVVRPGYHAERMELDIEADTETAVSVELENG